MSYAVAFERSAEKEFLTLPQAVRERVLKALQPLRADPFAARNVKSLKGGFYRLRVGDYRVIYSVMAEVLIILVVKVGHRREVYRN